VLLLSGGLDSAVLLASLVGDGLDPICLSFDYNQRHRRELDSAKRIAGFYRVEHIVVPLTGVFGPNALTSESVELPTGHYEDEAMSATVVPNRNMVFLSIATALALSRGLSKVWYGAHGGDSAIYPDCRPRFVSAMGQAMLLCDGKPVELIAPFLGMKKRDVVRCGVGLDVPFDLTWTCYKGGVSPCGVCGACVERAEAFAENGLCES
jgi:7-cyano-7-deazaguanine synthase